MQKKFTIKDEVLILDKFNSLKEKPKTEYTIEEIVIKFESLIKKSLQLGYTYHDIASLVFVDYKISGRLLKKTCETIFKITTTKIKKRLKSDE